MSKRAGAQAIIDDVTLGAIILQSILAEIDQNATGEDKMERALIGAKFMGDPIEPVEVNAKELGIIRDRIGKVQPALIVGQCWPILDSLGDKEPEQSSKGAKK